MKGRLSPKAQANLEKSFWACAKEYSKLAEAKIDVWESDGSENHHVTSRVSDFLVAQFLKDIPTYAKLKHDDGSTLQEQYEARLDYWNKWLDQRARRRLSYEDGSSYENYTIEALFNLQDFAGDPVLRRKADMFLDGEHSGFVGRIDLEERLRIDDKGGFNSPSWRKGVPPCPMSRTTIRRPHGR